MIVLSHYTHSILIRKPSLRWVMHNTLRIDPNDDLNPSNKMSSCIRSMPDMDKLLTLKYIL
jgi:hypothetical protein